MKWYTIVFIFLLFSCGSETEQNESKNVRGFYYWQTTFDISEEQYGLLNKLNCDVLYVRFFDLVQDSWDYVPNAEIEAEYDVEVPIPIVPTVFITTDVFYENDSSAIPRMAERVAQRIQQHNLYEDDQVNEIQFDCDWTPQIKDKYFYFLEEVQHYFPNQIISSTIRLYQYKYPKLAGVPPVDKGMLMYYNMGQFNDYDEENSILNNEIGEQYLGFNEYPLKIDIALPNFEWCLLFRQGQFQQICPNLTTEQLNNYDLFVSNKEGWYVCKKDTVINQTYFRFGDELRHEYCSKEELLKAAELLKEEFNQDETRILIYDLRSKTIEDDKKLDAVFSAFD